MAEQKVLTSEGYEKLKEKLDYLKGVKRREIAENIKIARSFGDLSENSEYDEAKNQQGIVEQEILDIEETLKNAKVVDEADLTIDIVGVGLKVKILDVEYKEEMEYRIVGSSESNPTEGLLSDESPIGRALIGRSVGDVVDAVTPGGTIALKVLEIAR